ncbi:MAG: alpha/beta hydrolase-fold protein [Verrucomicrobiota bacterium]
MKTTILLAASLSFVLTLGAAEKAATPDDQYKPGPDSMPQAGIPHGMVTKYTMADCKTYPGFAHDYWVYVPAQYNPAKPANLMVFQDGKGFADTNGPFRVPVVFDNLIHKKEMPVTIALMINPGDKPLKPGEAPRKRADGRPAGAMNRSVEYDTMSDAYAKFLIEEVIPEVAKQYRLTDNPEGWAICGNSSGGICSFTVAWERPDKFRKVVSHIGSFTNIRGGGKYPELVRTTPKKPLRVFLQDGKNDLVNQFGSWPEANQAMAAVLKEKGYDYQFILGEGTHSGKHGGSIFPDTLRWIWR